MPAGGMIVSKATKMTVLLLVWAVYQLRHVMGEKACGREVVPLRGGCIRGSMVDRTVRANLG